MRKKRWLLAAGLCLCFCLLFGACSGGGTETETTTQPVETDEGSGDTVRLVTGKKSDWAIVETGALTTADLRDAAADLQRAIRMRIGVELPIVRTSELQNNGKYIIIGDVNDDHYARGFDMVRESWGYGMYGYGTVGGRVICITGWQDSMTEKALNRFIQNLYVNDDDENLEIPAAWSANSNGWLTDVPHPSLGTPDGIYDCGDQTFQLLYRNCKEATFDTYLSELAGGNYQPVQQSGAGGNRFATWRSDAGEIRLSWAKSNGMLRIVCQNYGTVTTPAALSQEQQTEPKITEPQLAVMSLNYTAVTSNLTDCGGLSLVVTLPDGRFVIIDGGYSADADGLYNYLSDRNLREDGIVIAAWILTHGHADHIGCFEAFLKRYGDKVNCQALVSNALPSGVKMSSENNTGALNQMPAYCNLFASKPVYIKPHTGQTLWFGDLSMEVLMTHEECYPMGVSYLNETSMVFRLHLGGQSILVTGDAELLEVTLLNSLWGKTLKSDILQINHHGYSDIAESFFGNVSAEYAIWPSSQSTVNLRNSDSWRNGVFLRLTQSMKEWFVADGTVEILTLPYAGGYESYTMSFKER